MFETQRLVSLMTLLRTDAPSNYQLGGQAPHVLICSLMNRSQFARQMTLAKFSDLV
jgi:hypothetical protein